MASPKQPPPLDSPTDDLGPTSPPSWSLRGRFSCSPECILPAAGRAMPITKLKTGISEWYDRRSR